jgi:hypothetical protein
MDALILQWLTSLRRSPACRGRRNDETKYRLEAKHRLVALNAVEQGTAKEGGAYRLSLPVVLSDPDHVFGAQNGLG